MPDTSHPDPTTSEPIYAAPCWGPYSITKGIELEGLCNRLRIGPLRQRHCGQRQVRCVRIVGGKPPKDTEGIGITYRRKAWDVGFFEKHIGEMYNDSGTVNQAFVINPFNLTSAYINYTLKENSLFKQTMFRLSMENLSNERAIVGIGSPAAGSSSLNPSPNDQLVLLPGRSIMLSMTLGYSPRKQ